MKTITLLAVVISLLSVAGCAGLRSAIPSLNSCEHVKYERTGIKAHIEAECQL